MRDEFKIVSHGKLYVLYAGLLAEAHSSGLKEIDTELLQVPGTANGDTAIVRARVAMEGGGFFCGIGDASPRNVGRAIAPHLMRMAETRSKARALRDAPNIGTLAFEEMGETERAKPESDAPAPTPIRDGSGVGGHGRDGKAGKSQLDLLRTLAVELRGQGGIERMERHMGKRLSELTGAEADEWIDRLSPARKPVRANNA